MLGGAWTGNQQRCNPGRTDTSLRTGAAYYACSKTCSGMPWNTGPSLDSQDQAVADEQNADSLIVRVGGIGEYEPGSLIEAEQRGFFPADDGPGIPEGQREEALEDGFSTANDGTGLGLSIGSSIV